MPAPLPEPDEALPEIEPDAEVEIVVDEEPVGGRIVIVAVRGELDIATVPQLERRLGELQDAGRDRFALDLGEIDFFDSTLIALLVERQTALRGAGGGLAVVCATAGQRRLFEITGLEEELRVVGSREEALERLAPAASA